MTVDDALEEHFEYGPNGNRTLGYNRTAGTTYTGTYDDQDRLLGYGPFDDVSRKVVGNAPEKPRV